MDKKLPTKEEINKAKDLAIFLFNKVCNQLNITKSEITDEK